MARRWLKLGAGKAIGVATLVAFFSLLSALYGFEIIDLTGNISCEGTYENPCISYFDVRNPNAFDVDIYNQDEVKLYFSPEIKDYSLFIKDGRCKSSTGSCVAPNGLFFEGWKYMDFTNETKPRKDRVYVFRFPRYSTKHFLLAGVKNNPSDVVKWGFSTNNKDLDPIWDAVGGRMSDKIDVNGNSYLSFDIKADETIDVYFKDEGTKDVYDLNIDEVFSSYNKGKWKFGSISNKTEWSKRQIVFSSDLTLEKRKKGYYFIEGLGGYLVDVSDICPSFNNVTNVSTSCIYNSYTETHEEEVIDKDFGNYNVTIIDKYVLEVTFASFGFIDPSFTFESLETQSTLSDIRFEGDNSSHLEISTASPYDSLVLYMPFDSNVSTATTYDYSGNDNDGSVIAGTPHYVTDGVYGGAFEFDSANIEKLQIGTGSDLCVNGCTFSSWGRPSISITTARVLIGRSDGASVNEFFQFGGRQTNDLFFQITENGNSTFCLLDFDGNDWVAGDWKHLVGVYKEDGVGFANISIYSDGVFRATTVCAFTSINESAWEDSEATFIGGNDDSATFRGKWDGSIDEVMIFNTSLTPSQISDIFNNQSARFKQSGVQEFKETNLTLGIDNRINLSINLFQNNQNSNISARIAYWNTTKGYNVSDDGLVLYMGMNNESRLTENDSVVFDHSGNENNGTVVNATFNSNGRFNGGFDFDGDGDTINLGSGPSLSGPINFTVSAWIKTSKATIQTVVQQRNGGFNGQYYLRTGKSNNGRVEFAVFGNSAFQFDFSTSITVANNKWHHIVGIRNGTIGIIYVDGIQRATASGDIKSLSGGIKTIIGGDIRDGDKYFDGTIDEVAIWNRSLSASEIKALYIKGLAIYSYTEPQNISEVKTNFTFNIPSNQTTIFPEITFFSGTQSTQFYTPILEGAVNIDSWFEEEVEAGDTEPPVVTLVAPSDTLTTSITTHSFNATATDNFNASIMAFFIWDSSHVLINQTNISTSGTDVSANLTFNLTKEDTFIWNYLAFDNSSNSAFASSNFTITLEIPFPLINFTNPTLPSGTTTPNTTIAINVSISEANLNQVIFNWNGTNFTIMNDSLVLFMNFNNFSSLGESDTLVKDLSGNGNDGLVEGANFTTEGRYNGAFEFDGIDDSINVGDLDTPNNFSEGITISTWVKSDHSSSSSTKYEAEDDYRTTTGIADGNYWKGRQGIDTGGGVLFEHIIPNEDFGSQTIVVWGYQSSGGAVAGTFEVTDNETGEVLGSGSLVQKLIGDSDKRMNNPFIFGGTGHDYRIRVNFSDTRDLYIDYIVFNQIGYEGIIGKGGELFNFFLNGGTFRIAFSGTSSTSSTTGGNINLGNWQNAIVTYDYENIKLYVDGVLKTTTPFNQILKTSAEDFYIGYSVIHGTNARLWGSIDDVMIWNRSLSSEEIQQLYFTSLTKHNNSEWTLFVNQSLDSTTELGDGNYTYQAFAINDAGKLNQTEQRVVIISAVTDSCTPPASGNWDISCADNCTFSSEQQVPGNISINNSGNVTLESGGIWNFTTALSSIWINSPTNTCEIFIESGGGFN